MFCKTGPKCGAPSFVVPHRFPSGVFAMSQSSAVIVGRTSSGQVLEPPRKKFRGPYDTWEHVTASILQMRKEIEQHDKKRPGLWSTLDTKYKTLKHYKKYMRHLDDIDQNPRDNLCNQGPAHLCLCFWCQLYLEFHAQTEKDEAVDQLRLWEEQNLRSCKLVSEACKLLEELQAEAYAHSDEDASDAGRSDTELVALIQ